jgi:hypothetical protein
MHIQEAIKNIAEKNLTEMKQNFYAALSEKAVGILEERKIDMAKFFFAKKEEEDEEEDNEKEKGKKKEKED